MATAKKSTEKKAALKKRVQALTISIIVYRQGGSFTAPVGSTFGILPSGALIIQHSTTPNLLTHAFAPGEWKSVNQP